MCSSDAVQICGVCTDVALDDSECVVGMLHKCAWVCCYWYKDDKWAPEL